MLSCSSLSLIPLILKICFVRTDLYEEERIESKALKLRLTLHETQALEYRHRIHGMELDHHKNEAFTLGTVTDSRVILLYHTKSYHIQTAPYLLAL